METVSRSQGSLEEELGREGKASAKTAAYGGQENKSAPTRTVPVADWEQRSADPVWAFSFEQGSFCH